MNHKGYVQIYTGPGKGKTTAALGLSVRACCAGFKVLFLQFVKSGFYNETKLVNHMPGIQWEQYGEGRFILGKPTQEDVALAKDGMRRLREAAISGEWDVVVADEACVAHSLGLIETHEMLSLFREKAQNTELILTGRGAPPEWIEAADLVTEMNEIKHYYNSGVQARTGIEC